MTRIAMCVLALMCLSIDAMAQDTVLQVPYDRAAFHWDTPPDPPPAGTGVVKWYLLNCGGDEVRIDMPATSIPLKDAVATLGAYTCTLRAANEFGVSLPSNSVSFEAGLRPAASDNLRIEVR